MLVSEIDPIAFMGSEESAAEELIGAADYADIISATFSGGMTPVNNCSAFSGAPMRSGVRLKNDQKSRRSGIPEPLPNNSESWRRALPLMQIILIKVP